MDIITGDIDCETVSLDGKHFKDCTLSNCTLLYAGGTVVLERTLITGCRYSFGEEAQRTVDLLRVTGLLCEGLSGDYSNSAVLN